MGLSNANALLDTRVHDARHLLRLEGDCGAVIRSLLSLPGHRSVDSGP